MFHDMPIYRRQRLCCLWKGYVSLPVFRNYAALMAQLYNSVLQGDSLCLHISCSRISSLKDIHCLKNDVG